MNNGKFSKDIINTIGDTPLVEISQISPNPDIRFFAKLESRNPGGSVKDRVAKYLIESAEAKGLIKPGSTIIEPTSGNTGISLAMICRVKGYNLQVVMPENVSKERISILESFGAEIIFSEGEKGTNGAIDLAKNIAENNPDLFMPFQYGNFANPQAHYETTGPEIIKDLPDLDVFVAGLGTGGTLMGVGRSLKEYNSKIKIIAAAPHPDEVVPALRSIEHGFIPPILDLDELDGRLLVEAEEAFFWTKQLLDVAGVFAGISSGAVIAAARKVAEKMTSGKIVCLLADGGWKYLSTGLWTRKYGDIESEIQGKIWW